MFYVSVAYLLLCLLYSISLDLRVCVCVYPTFGWYIEYVCACVSVWVCELAPVYYMQFLLVLLLFCWNIYLCLRKSVCVCAGLWWIESVFLYRRLTRTCVLWLELSSCPPCFVCASSPPPQSFPRCRAYAQGACDVSHSWGRKLVHGNMPHTFVCREDPPPPNRLCEDTRVCARASVYFCFDLFS